MVVVVGEGGLFGKISSVKAWRFLRSPPIEGTNIFLSFLQNLDILDQVLGVILGVILEHFSKIIDMFPRASLLDVLDGDIV